MPNDGQIGKTAAQAQPPRVLCQSAVAHLGEPEHLLDHTNRVLNLDTNSEFRAVLAALRGGGNDEAASVAG